MGNKKKRESCLEVVKRARAEKVRKWKDEEELEEVRENVRIQYIEKIEKINKMIGEREKGVGVKKDKINQLKDKQALERSSVDVKIDRKIVQNKLNISKLEKELADMRQNLADLQHKKRKNEVEVQKKYQVEMQNLESEYEEDESQLSN